MAALLSRQPLPRGRRVAVLTNAGGLGILCADACEAAGLELPRAVGGDASRRCARAARRGERSPTRSTCSAPRPRADYGRALPLLLDDPRVDSVIVLFVPPVSAGAAEVADAIELARAGAAKPVLAVAARRRAGAQGALLVRGLPVPGVGSARARPSGRARRLAATAGRDGPGARRDRPGRRRTVVAAALSGDDDVWLDPAETKRLLEALRAAARSRSETPRDADAGGRRGARARLPGRRQERASRARTRPRAGASHSTCATRPTWQRAVATIGGPVIVQPMLRDGTELLAGLVQDPVFGPLVAFGPGGVLAELIGDANFRLAPLTDIDAEELVNEGKAGRLVPGSEGRRRMRRR